MSSRVYKLNTQQSMICFGLYIVAQKKKRGTRCFGICIGSIYLSWGLFFSASNLGAGLDAHKKSFDEEVYNWSTVIAEVFNHARSKLYYPVVMEQAVIKMLDSFIKQDPHSRVLGPKEYKELMNTTSGEFHGIGIIVAPQKKPDEEYIVVLGTKKNSPAQRAGIQKYDKIIAINNRKVADLSLDEALSLLQGERYSTVDIAVLRHQSVLHLRLVRDLLKEDHVSGYVIHPYNIAYCAVDLFAQHSAEQLGGIIRKINEKKPHSLILDLRDNIGGVVQSAVDCASLFLPEKSLVLKTKNKAKEVIEQFETISRPLLSFSMPIVILINQNTSSCAEIVAGCLQEHAKLSVNRDRNKLVFLLGLQTHGKGSVQEVIPLSNNCALKLTTCLYYLPSDISIDSTGIIPDFIIEPKLCLTPEIRELQGITKKTDPTAGKRISDPVLPIQSDFQLMSAINLLGLLNVAKKAYPEAVSSQQQAVSWLKKKLVLAQQEHIEEIL